MHTGKKDGKGIEKKTQEEPIVAKYMNKNIFCTYST